MTTNGTQQPRYGLLRRGVRLTVVGLVIAACVGGGLLGLFLVLSGQAPVDRVTEASGGPAIASPVGSAGAQGGASEDVTAASLQGQSFVLSGERDPDQ